MTLWLILAVMTAVALAFLLLPLVRRHAVDARRLDYDIAVFRDQLAEIDRDLEFGIISPSEADAARTEVKRRLLATADGGTGASMPSANIRRIAALVLAIALPAAALVTYAVFGTPDAPDRLAALRLNPEVADTGSDERQRRVDVAVDRTRAEPENASAWAELGNALVVAGRPAEAVSAYEKAINLGNRQDGLLSAYGEALTMAAQGTVTPAAKEAFESALKAEPRDPAARYYLGLADYQAGRARAALDAWTALESDSVSGAPWLPALRSRIATVAAEAGIDPGKLTRPSPQGPGPDQADIAAAADMSAGDRQTMIESMVARLAARLESEPNDLEGWRRLARSYEVLGRTADARDAMARAADLARKDPEVLAEYGRLAFEAADAPVKVPPEVADIMRRVLVLDAKNPLALWFVGNAAAQAGNDVEALTLWTRLLAQLKPGTPQYDTLKARIDGLDGTQ